MPKTATSTTSERPREYPYEPGKYPYLESTWDEVANSRLNVKAFFETWGKIWGDRYGCDVTLESIVNKETGEVEYQREKAHAS